jgi:hypothetical protein
VQTTDAVDPAPPAACSACGGPLDALGRCGRGGAVFSEAYRCPLCQAQSDIEPDPTLYFRCRVCGGPRVPPSAGSASDGETALLKAARAEQMRAGAYRVGSGFLLASGLLSLFVTNVVLLATSPAPLAKAFALFASAVPLLLSFVAFRRASGHKRRLMRTLDQAWLSTAQRIVANAGGEVSASTLAKTLRIDEARAELLLAELSVQDLVQPQMLPAKIRVTELADPGELLAVAAQREADASTRKP